MYSLVDAEGFPEARLNPKELIFLRSWQGGGIARIFYYAGLIFLVVSAVL